MLTVVTATETPVYIILRIKKYVLGVDLLKLLSTFKVTMSVIFLI
jgi:hypothetical protein